MLLIILFILIIVFIFYRIRRKEYLTISDKYHIGKSNIDGQGILASKFIPKNEIIDVAIYDRIITPYFGKYINHCNKPSTYIKKINNKYYIIALKNININDEITCDYDQANMVANFISPAKKYYKC